MPFVDVTGLLAALKVPGAGVVAQPLSEYAAKVTAVDEEFMGFPLASRSLTVPLNCVNESTVAGGCEENVRLGEDIEIGSEQMRLPLRSAPR